MNCTLCGLPVVISPSAAERAARYGGKASDYTRLFTTHTRCALDKREQGTLALMRRQHG